MLLIMNGQYSIFQPVTKFCMDVFYGHVYILYIDIR